MTRKEFEKKYGDDNNIGGFKHAVIYLPFCTSCGREIKDQTLYYELYLNTVSPYEKFCQECYEELKKEYDV